MGVKIECDGCGRQVPNGPVEVNGWLSLTTVENYPLGIGQPDVNGMFCTPTCMVEKLRRMNLVLPDVITEDRI